MITNTSFLNISDSSLVTDQTLPWVGTVPSKTYIFASVKDVPEKIASKNSTVLLKSNMLTQKIHYLSDQTCQVVNLKDVNPDSIHHVPHQLNNNTPPKPIWTGHQLIPLNSLPNHTTKELQLPKSKLLNLTYHTLPNTPSVSGTNSDSDHQLEWKLTKRDLEDTLLLVLPKTKPTVTIPTWETEPYLSSSNLGILLINQPTVSVLMT
jgi:hypothetical protein